MVRESRLSAEPVRTCVGCRRKASQSTLIRFVVEGLDAGAKQQLILGKGQPGRGAWLCSHKLCDCFDAAVEHRRWNQALRAKIDPESISSVRMLLLSRHGVRR